MSMSLNMYDGTWNPGGIKHSVVASSLEDAAKVLKLNYENDPMLIQCVQEGVAIAPPPVQVTFTTGVSPAEAATAHCVATPTEYAVEGGTSLLFEAIAAAGWAFSKWSINGVDVIGGARAMLIIPGNVATSQVVAHFTAVV